MMRKAKVLDNLILGVPPLVLLSVYVTMTCFCAALLIRSVLHRFWYKKDKEVMAPLREAANSQKQQDPSSVGKQ